LSSTSQCPLPKLRAGRYTITVAANSGGRTTVRRITLTVRR
jgi:hypothetical protein